MHRVTREHLATKASVFHAPKEWQSTGVARISQHRDGPALGDRLQ
jgi:hypothetical protein